MDINAPKMNTAETLTIADVIALAQIVDAASHSHRLIRVMGDHHFAGTARHLCGPDGGPRSPDIRNAFLRVTLDGGSDAYWPLSDLVRDVISGHLALNYSR